MLLVAGAGVVVIVAVAVAWSLSVIAKRATDEADQLTRELALERQRRAEGQ